MRFEPRIKRRARPFPSEGHCPPPSQLAIGPVLERAEALFRAGCEANETFGGWRIAVRLDGAEPSVEIEEP